MPKMRSLVRTFTNAAATHFCLGVTAEDLRLVAAHRGSSSRFVFTEAGLANAYLTRLQWKVLNELHSEILAPVFEMRNLVRRAVLGYKFWATRQAALTARMRHRDQLVEEGITDDGMFHLGQVGLTSGASARGGVPPVTASSPAA